MSSLSGKTAVVLGASGTNNFGTAIARKLAREGANVVVAGRRQEPLNALANEINGKAICCDVTEEDQIQSLFDSALSAYGNVDIAVNSAGIHAGSRIADLDADKIRPTLETSFIGALLFFKWAAASMKHGGSVITVSSLTTRLPGPELAVYSGARAGIDHAIKIAAVEYAADGIRFNSIAAGLIQTDMTAPFFGIDALIDAYVEDTPVGRMGTIEDMAQAALFLADGERSGFINGQVLDLAGGQQMGHLPRL